MAYKDRISLLMEQIPTTLVDMEAERPPIRIPSQASSEFTTNREQGDWAENIMLAAINQTTEKYVAVRYGMGDDRVAGEEGFKEFFENFQREVDEIGKRPDILVFKRDDLPTDWGNDISRRPRAELDEIVPKAIVGLEVRSSAFLSKKYDEVMRERKERHTQDALAIKSRIETEYTELLNTGSRRAYLDVLAGITAETMRVIDFKRPTWRSSPQLVEAAQAFSDLKTSLEELRKRDHLSITPKIEDLRVVYHWVQTYGVPHFYVQVFFDRAYALSYEHILTLLTDPANEETRYFTEGDVKNQKKMTVKINPEEGYLLAPSVDEPDHASRRKELRRGQLLFYVTFTNGAAQLDSAALAKLLRVNLSDL
ncbi:restriction endonuclease [Hymenobacter psoromatis]|nr:restriction endonuclease [Hymenobacter psoromatis]